MKVKVIDEEHEGAYKSETVPLTYKGEKGKICKENNIDIIDIKLSSSCSIYSEEQIYCFTALIMYTEIKEE